MDVLGEFVAAIDRREARRKAMGYNLWLYCRTCDERAYCSRGNEAISIKQFIKRHPDDSHRREIAIDNGFAEQPWIDEPDRDSDLYLPDDVRGTSAKLHRTAASRPNA